jgi:hypothetical protein
MLKDTQSSLKKKHYFVAFFSFYPYIYSALKGGLRLTWAVTAR